LSDLRTKKIGILGMSTKDVGLLFGGRID